jgi:hypothetical protein
MDKYLEQLQDDFYRTQSQQRGNPFYPRHEGAFRLTQSAIIEAARKKLNNLFVLDRTVRIPVDTGVMILSQADAKLALGSSLIGKSQYIVTFERQLGEWQATSVE